MNNPDKKQAVLDGEVSWLRVGLLVVGVLALLPLALLFGIYGFVTACLFILLAALAR